MKPKRQEPLKGSAPINPINLNSDPTLRNTVPISVPHVPLQSERKSV